MNEKKYLSADEYLRDTWKLAAAVRKSEWKPDILIALWRGGAAVGVALHEYFKVSGWSVQPAGVEFTHGDLVFGLLRPGDRVLVVDDVFDTGKTARAVKERIDAKGAEMRLACVYWKPEKNITNLKPDYFVKDVGLDWIVFPHEIEGLTKEEIAVKDPLLSSLLG